MYIRAALLALALGHASAAIEPLDALRAVDDAQLMAEVARRNLDAPQDHRALSVEQHYSFKYECSCDPTPAPVSSQPTPAPQVDVCDMCKTKAGTKCGSGFRLPGGNCDKVLQEYKKDCDDGCLKCSKSGTITNAIEGYGCEDRRRLDGPAARPAWATGAPQEESSPMIPSWASQHRRLGGGKGSCYIPGSDTELPLCKTVGKCGKKDKCGKLKCGGGYVTGSGKKDCVKSPKCSNKCKGKQVNYNQCDNCVDPQVVCDAEEDDCLKDEADCEEITGATFCPKYEGGTTDKCGKFGKCGEGYWIGSGKHDCKKDQGCRDCEDDLINYNQCGNCVDKDEVCEDHP